MSTYPRGKIFPPCVDKRVPLLHVRLSCSQSNGSAMRSDREYTDLEKRLYWECLKMETRYAIDIPLPESGLGSLDLITQLWTPYEKDLSSDSSPMPESWNDDLTRSHASQFDLLITQFGLQSLSNLYSTADTQTISKRRHRVSKLGRNRKAT